MILQAFSQVLHRERRRTDDSAEKILHRWLLAVLTEAEPNDMVSHVIHAEVAMRNVSGQVSFLGRSRSGEALLDNLFRYCESYERWQFGRWLHELKPHNFNHMSH